MVRWAVIAMALLACARRGDVPVAALAPGAASARVRGPVPEAEVLVDALAAAIARVQPERAAPVHDPALDRVAQVAAATASADYVVGATALRAAMAAHLRSGLDPHVLTARGDDATARAQLLAAIVELRAQAGIASVGVAAAGVGPARVVAVVALPPPNQPTTIARTGSVARVDVPWPWPAPPHGFIVTAATRRLVPPRSTPTTAVTPPPPRWRPR